MLLKKRISLSDNALSLNFVKRENGRPFYGKAPLEVLERQVVIYIPSLMIPGLVNLLALAFYTRILDTAAYGRYIIILSIVVTAKMVVFEWLRLGILRFFQAKQSIGDLNALISTSLYGFAIVCLIILIPWIICATFLPINNLLKKDLWFALPLLLIWTLFEQILQMNRAALNAKRYGILSTSKAIFGLFASMIFITIFRLSENGVFLGLVFGAFVSVLIDWPRWLSRFNFRLIRRDIGVELLRYGIPFTLTLGMGLVISLSDRFMLQHFIGSEAVGVYAASYDLVNQSVMMVFTLLNLAAYPIVLKALDKGGIDSARKQLQQYAVILIALALPISVGLALTAKPFAAVFLGEDFQQVGWQVMPWISVATFLMGAKAFYADLSFQIGLRTDLQIWPVAVAALLNVCLNLWWIPVYGVIGAAKATCFSYLLALVLSLSIGWRVFKLPYPFSTIWRILLATLVMTVGLKNIQFRDSGWKTLLIMFAAGTGSYLVMVWIMNIGNARGFLSFKLHYLKNLLKQ